jgi:hypothetical protein
VELAEPSHLPRCPKRKDHAGIIAIGTDTGVIAAWCAETREPLAVWTASGPIKCLAVRSAEESDVVLIGGIDAERGMLRA